jgi:hypothetical protein
MKKIIYVIVALFLAMFPIFGVLISKLEADAPSYSHQMKITVTDTSGSNRTNVVAVLTLGGSTLFTSGFINSDGTDTDMENNGTEFNYMMADAEIPVYIGNLGNDASQVINLDMGYSPLKTNFPIIVGDGGFITTPYNASLELGSSWEIDINSSTTPTYINTSDVGAYILDKAGEATIQVTSAGELTATVYDGSLETIVLTGVTSGNYYPILSLSGGVLNFIVGSHSGITSVGTVVNNTNDWIWDSDGLVMPYINSINVSKHSIVETIGTPVTAVNPSAQFSSDTNDNRKQFYANGRYWMIELGGLSSGNQNLIYTSSIDGTMWDVPTTIRDASENITKNIDVYFDGTYCYYVFASGYSGVYFRRGTPNSDGTITWSTAEQQIVSDGNGYTYYVHITTDGVGGHPYVLGTLQNPSNSGGQWVYKSSTTDGTFSEDAGYPLNLGAQSGGMWATQIMSTGSGICVIGGVGSGSATIFFRYFNGSTWGAKTTIATYSDTQNLRAVSIGGTVYCIYFILNGSDYDLYSFQGTPASNSWTMPVLVKSGFPAVVADASLTTDSTNDGLICFWGGYPTQYHLYYMKYYNGNWDASETSLLTDTDYQYYESYSFNTSANIYSNNVIGISWTVNDNATYPPTWPWETKFITLAITTPVISLLYQPNTIVSGTTLPDLDGTENGVITWGTNPDMTIEYGVVTSTITGIPTGLNATIASDTSHRWLIPGFSEVLVNTQSTLKKFPFWDIFAPVASDTDPTHPNGGGINTNPNGGITLYGLYLLMGGAVVLAIGAWVAMLTGSRIVLLISLVIMMSIFVAPLFSAWMVIVLIVGGISILYLVRQG